MRALLVISLLVAVVGALTSQRLTPTRQNEGKIWALLIAGSNSWWNYRHQADICHAFHVLKNHGVQEENIITMMYDDIANNPENPYPGKIFNRPNGPDVYEGVKIDYKGKDVTPENFLAVLQGQEEEIHGGNGRVLNTTSDDKIFVYFSDHGAPGSIAFPDDVLTVKQLNQALKSMHSQKRFGQLVFYLEACESGSMFEKVLPKNIDVYALTAANSRESSWGCYCGTSSKLSTCLGDLFSVNWLEDSDAENLHTETLERQFEIVKQKTNQSHVQKYGNLDITNEPVADFQGEQDAPSKDRGNVNNYELWPSRDIPIKTLEVKLRFMNDKDEERKIVKQLARIQHKREYLRNHTESLVRKLIHDTNIRRMIMTKETGPITKLDCHHNVLHAYNRICFNLGTSPYATSYVKVLANLCEYGLSSERILHTMMDHCLDIKHKNIL
ncbi:Legumain [Aphelenchoides bicaudatus]|nr:Legumain [Aphelenchoides bicaudatus]